MPSETVSGGLISALRHFMADHGVTATGVLAGLGSEVAARPRIAELVTTYLDEGPVAIELVAPHLGRPSRILEVGSGIGLVSRFLAELGHEVVATEPAPAGFDLMRDIAAAIDEICGPVPGPGSLHRLDLGVDDLDPAVLGRFDLVFSANVIEHVPDPERALLHLQRFVTEDGVQTHVCPNYAFPYDPHIGRPLLPLIPAATRPLLPRHLRDDAAFRTVNFVTAHRVRRTARSAGLDVAFTEGLLGAALDRFASDTTFSDRHAGIGPAVGLVRLLGLARLVAKVPPLLASPMRFTLRSRSLP